MQIVLLDLSENRFEGFGGLWWSWWTCTLINSPCLLFDLCPVLELHCVVLISRSQNKGICPRKCCHISSVPLLPSHHVLYHNILLPTILGWLHVYSTIGVWDTHLCLLGFYTVISNTVLIQSIINYSLSEIICSSEVGLSDHLAY